MGYGQDIAVLRSCWIGTSTFEQYESITAGQAVEMREVAEQAKIKHMVGFSWRCLPIIKGMYDLVKDGYIGTCFNGCGPMVPIGKIWSHGCGIDFNVNQKQQPI